MTATGTPSNEIAGQRTTGRGKGQRGKSLRPYLYLAPAATFLALVFIYPFMEIVRTSLQVPSATGTPTFGFENYKFLLGDPVFKKAVVHNLILLLSVPIMTVLALLFALILFDQIRGWKVYRTIIFTPYILAIPVVGTTFIYLYSTDGILNEILRSGGVGFLAKDWLGSPKFVLPSIMSVIIYRELGFGVVLFLARLMSLPYELLEAAKLDGANWYQMHRHVTIPQMRSVIEFFVVVEIMTMLSWVFAYVYTMTGGGPGFSSVIMEFYIWQNAFDFQSPAIASALAVVLLVAVSGLIFVQNRLRRRSVDVDDDL